MAEQLLVKVRSNSSTLNIVVSMQLEILDTCAQPSLQLKHHLHGVNIKKTGYDEVVYMTVRMYPHQLRVFLNRCPDSEVYLLVPRELDYVMGAEIGCRDTVLSDLYVIEVMSWTNDLIERNSMRVLGYFAHPDNNEMNALVVKITQEQWEQFCLDLDVFVHTPRLFHLHINNSRLPEYLDTPQRPVSLALQCPPRPHTPLPTPPPRYQDNDSLPPNEWQIRSDDSWHVPHATQCDTPDDSLVFETAKEEEVTTVTPPTEQEKLKPEDYPTPDWYYNNAETDD